MWTVNFPILKLVLEKTEEPETELLTSAGSLIKQESSNKTSIPALLTMPKPLTVWITINCGKFWKRWEYQTTWPASWEDRYEGHEATVGSGHGTTNWFQIGKGVHQGCILSPCLFNLHAEYIMRNAGLDDSQAGIKIAGRNINNFRYADNTTLMAESEEELERLLIKVKEESEKTGLKLNIQKPKIMALSPIISWQIDGGKNRNSERLYFIGLQNHCRWWLQPQNEKTVVPWKKSYDKPRQNIKKQRHYLADTGMYS